MSTAPQYVTKPSGSAAPATLTAANTATDGTGSTGRALIATAEAVTGGGSILPLVLVAPLGTNVATVVRFFLNNGSDPETAGNNAYIGEVAMAATTKSETAASLAPIPFDLRAICGFPGLVMRGHASTPWRLYATLATAVAAGVKITPMNFSDLNS